MPHRGIAPRIGTPVEPLDLPRPRIDPDRILRLQKYTDPARAAPVVQDTATRMASLAETLVEPRGWLRRVPVLAVDSRGCVRLDGELEFHSRALARLLRDAREAFLVILTVGPALEHRVRELVDDGQLAEGLLLDTAGWTAVEALLSQTRSLLRAEGRSRGLRLSARLAPGFGDWRLQEQRVLFEAFVAASLSVTLTDACLMLPRKSASAAYGLIPVVPV